MYYFCPEKERNQKIYTNGKKIKEGKFIGKGGREEDMSLYKQKGEDWINKKRVMSRYVTDRDLKG